jgi:DNA-binding XRE family transcriptional regulator
MVNAFPDGWGGIPNAPLIAASIAALFHGGPGARAMAGGWSPDHEGRLQYRHTCPGGDQISISFDSVTLPAGEGDAGLDSQWSIVERFSPLTVDVLLAVLARTCGPWADRRSKDPIPVTARAVLCDKGLQRWGAEGESLRQRVDEEIARLQGLRVDVPRLPAPDRKLRHPEFGHESAAGGRLLELVEPATVGAARDRGPARPDTVWFMRLGPWSRIPADSCAGNGLVAVPQRILEIDHRRNRGSAVLAKKIGLDALMLWDAMPSRGPLDRRIGDVLEAVGELPRTDARSVSWGARLNNRLGQAIRMLQEMGILGGVSWPAGFQPGGADRARGWVDSWLACRIVFDRPIDHGASRTWAAARLHKGRRARATAPGPAQLRRGSAIRAMRLERDISQSRLARELGVSAAYLSQIENERRMVSRAMLARIAGWVRRNGEIERGGDNNSGVVATIGSGNGGRRTVVEQQETGSGIRKAPAAGTSIGKEDRT